MKLEAILVVEDSRSVLASRYVIQAGIPAIVVTDSEAAYSRMHRNSFRAILLTPTVDIGPLEFVLNAREIHSPVPIVVPATGTDGREQETLREMLDVHVIDGTHSQFVRNALTVLSAAR
jgi:DNA-binding response OmpR family regulator